METGETGSSEGSGGDGDGDAEGGETSGGNAETGNTSEDGSGADISPVTLAIGDSVLDWNVGEGSIPEVWAEAAALEMENAAVGGAMMLDSEEGIPTQYEAGDWGRVLVNGGANDIGPDGCGCGNCMAVVDELIDAQANAGTVVDLVQEIRADGAQVVLLGYYTVSPESEFGACDEELAALSQRYALLASGDPMVVFVDAAEVMDYMANPDYYEDDLIHPSIAGSAAIGNHIADRVNGS